ncbi:MAG: capsule assembly Wzi family protein [Nitrospiraceae bacterium]
MALVVGSGLLGGGRAQASVNLPLHHWAYEAIERLTALGVIDRAMVVPKPYSRKQAAKYVARAIEGVRADQVPLDGREAIAEPLLDRLMRELRPELTDLGAISARRASGRDTRESQDTQQTQKTRDAIRYGARLQTEFDAFSVGGGQTVRFRENRGGEYYVNGEQNQTDVRGWFELTDWAAFTVQPKFISNRHILGIGATNNSQNFYLREFNLKLSHFNIALEAGRGTQWWGPGYHGSLLLTDHAFPLDMIKLGSDEPFRLPWLLRGLGDWKVNSFLAQLDRDRDFSRAKLFGLRISYLPTSWLELGVTRLTQFGGRGRNQSFPKAVTDAYTSAPNQEGDRQVNEQVMLDFRATVPKIPYLLPFPGGMQLYGELGSEDKWSQIPFPSRNAILGGVYIPQVFPGDSMDLRIEYADTDIGRRRHPELTQVWYNNGTYVSGMRYRGFPLGHHMGTDGIDFFVRTTRYLTETLQLGTNFNLQERDRGAPVHERKREAALDLTWWLSSQTQFTVGYTYQRLRNPGQITSINPFIETFAPGVIANNHFLWTSLVVEF